MPAPRAFLKKVPVKAQKHTGQGDDRPLPGAFLLYGFDEWYLYSTLF